VEAEALVALIAHLITLMVAEMAEMVEVVEVLGAEAAVVPLDTLGMAAMARQTDHRLQMALEVEVLAVLDQVFGVAAE
jgi:hypothetical protein